MKTDNELIAEFMGIAKESNGCYHIENLRHLYASAYLKPDYLDYHRSWDWFMPAYSNFSALDYDENKLNDEHADHCASIAERVLSFDLFGANEKLVEGIKWYNDSHPKAVKK